MAYTVNGKVFTDHPLMDEIVYNTKLILKNIVIKNEMLANDYEDNDFYPNVETRKMIVNGTITFGVFPFTIKILEEFGYDKFLANAILINRDNAPISDRDSLLSFASKYFMDHYEEPNKYYRMLMGLPEYGTDEFDIYVEEDWFPKEVDTSKYDLTVPIHKLDRDAINILKSNGKIQELIDTYRGFNYGYLRFLADSAIDLDTARQATKFEILYFPIVEDLVADRFKELYNLNRDVYFKHTYSDAFSYYSDYYDEIIILMLLAQTFNDMIVDVPEWYIRRDIFDIRSVQYFLEAYGVKFFKIIPLKYQVRIVKNLNKLIKYKSSNKNFDDIINDIFSAKNVSIFKFFIYKRRNIAMKKDEPESYDLEFVRAEVNDSYDNYIKDYKYRSSYDDITLQDKYWDGEDPHEYVRQKHLALDFTIQGTKYMTIEYYVDMAEYLFQMEYFLGLILDSSIDTSDIRIGIPSIDPNIKFRLSDLFLLLYLMTLSYDNCSTAINLPKKKTGKNKPEFTKYDDFDGGYPDTPESEYDPWYSANGQPNWFLTADGGQTVFASEIQSQERFYDWMKRQYPEIFNDEGEVRQYRYNMKADMKALAELLSRRHIQFQFEHGYTLEDFGVEDFWQVDKIDTIERLIEVYYHNKDIYDHLKVMMTDKRPQKENHRLMEYIFRQLFTAPFDYDYYTINNGKVQAKKLEELLLDKDYILYNLYMKLASETNLETRQDNIRDIMNDIINILEYYISDEGLNYIFAFTTINSFSNMVKYIYLMINFFKSYKVYFLDPYVTYNVSGDGKNKLEFDHYAHDYLAQRMIHYIKWDKQFVADNMDYNIRLEFESEHRYREKKIIEVVDISGHFDPDPEDDYDYDGKYADTDEPFKDADGGYAPDTSCIPFVMLNGGDSSEGQRSMWDLDGSTAIEMQNYYDVDAGYAFHEDDLYHDYYHTAFQYILDGGSAGTNRWISRTIHTQIIDNQIVSNIRISNYTENKLVTKKDGLYLEQHWAAWSDFLDLYNDSMGTFDYFTNSYNNLLEIVQIAGDEDILNSKINDYLDIRLKGAREVVKYANTSTFEQDYREYVDNHIRTLYNEFYNYSPFAWEEF